MGGEIASLACPLADPLAVYIEEWAADIYVREQVDGKSRPYALSELPAKMTMRHATRR